MRLQSIVTGSKYNGEMIHYCIAASAVKTGETSVSQSMIHFAYLLSDLLRCNIRRRDPLTGGPCHVLGAHAIVDCEN